MAVQIQVRRDTAANWTSNDPTIASGEIGLETDTGKVKIGDGSTAWTSLKYLFGEAAFAFVIDGGGLEITTGVKGDLEVPFDCEIQSVTLLADQGGAIVIDIWSQAYADFPPEIGESITAAALPTITATADKSQDSTLSGWTTALTKGDTLRFNVDSVTDIERVTLSLKVNKT